MNLTAINLAHAAYASIWHIYLNLHWLSKSDKKLHLEVQRKHRTAYKTLAIVAHDRVLTGRK